MVAMTVASDKLVLVHHRHSCVHCIVVTTCVIVTWQYIEYLIVLRVESKWQQSNNVEVPVMLLLCRMLRLMWTGL